MRVFTGDSVGCLKVTDLVAKTVDVLLKPAVVSRAMAVTSMSRDASRPNEELLVIGRKCGLVECVDSACPDSPRWLCAVPGGSVVFCELVANRLVAVLEGGLLVLIDPRHPALSADRIEEAVAAREVDSEDEQPQEDEEDDPKVCCAKMLLAEAGPDWFDTKHRPAWVLDAVDLNADAPEECDKRRITCAFLFSAVDGKQCVGVVGYHMPLKIWEIVRHKSFRCRYSTTHSGRIFDRDRAPKLMCAGHLGELAERDGLFTVDQRGKCRLYVMHNPDACVRSRGPLITFQATMLNACPNIVKLMSDDFHREVIENSSLINKECKQGEPQDDESADEDCDDGDEETVLGDSEPRVPEFVSTVDDAELEAAEALDQAEEAAEKYEGEAQAVPNGSEETEEDTESSEVECEDDDAEFADLKAIEDQLLDDDKQYCWCFGVGDAKGGAYVVQLLWQPNSTDYARRFAKYQRTGYLEEFYERTRINRRLRVNVVYRAGVLIDTSPLDYGDHKRHERFKCALHLNVTDSFKRIPGAVNCMEYLPSEKVVALAGLDRRLYIYSKQALLWFQTHKINLKNKINAVVSIPASG